jgi:hypothetical protein
MQFNGIQVSYKGVTKVIGNSTNSIKKYLAEIGAGSKDMIKELGEGAGGKVRKMKDKFSNPISEVQPF